MAKKATILYGPKEDVAAEWEFHPSERIRNEYPDAQVEFVGMELQGEEALSLLPIKTEKVKGTLVITTKGGRVVLKEFAENWLELNALPDGVVWDVFRMIGEFSSND